MARQPTELLRHIIQNRKKQYVDILRAGKLDWWKRAPKVVQAHLGAEGRPLIRRIDLITRGPNAAGAG